MSHISTLASSDRLIGYISAGRQKLHSLQVSVGTEMVSQNYSGVARESSRLLNIETTRSVMVRFSENNALMQGRLQMTETALNSLDATMRDFRQVLLDEGGSDPLQEDGVATMQQAAHRALENMELFLNTKLNGRHLFSGSQVATKPVDFNLTTLEAFQERYDGAHVTYPTTRAAHLERFSIQGDINGGADWLTFERDSTGTGGPGRITSDTAEFANVAVGTTLTITGTQGDLNNQTVTVAAVGGGGTYIDIVSEYFRTETTTAVDDATITLADGTVLDYAATGDLTFAPGGLLTDPETMTAATAGALANLEPGTTFTIAGSTSNDGTYTVSKNDTTTVTIEAKKLVNQGTPSPPPPPAGTEVAGTITAQSYYAGDSVAHAHAVDDQRDLTFDLTAINPAFEKAIRAMGLIAQGEFGTEGGLDQNAERVEQAMYLMNSAIERVVAGTPPFGDELSGNIEDVRIEAGFQQVVLNDAQELHAELIARYEMQVADIEMIDPHVEVAKLLDQSTALEASMRALSRVRELSLVNYL